MNKKVLLIIMPLLMMIMFGAGRGVKATDISNDSGGEEGATSASCGTGVCSNTVGLTLKTGKKTSKKFSNTAIYGIRITIVDGDGKAVDSYKPKNFWATENMLNVTKYNTLNKKTNYDNYWINGGMLWSYKQNGNYCLHDIDTSGCTYSEYVGKQLTDEVILNKFLKKWNTTASKLASKEYQLKIEPIFVLHYQYYSTHIYYVGTPHEILDMIDEKGGSGIYWGIYYLTHDDPGWNVMENFFATIHENEKGLTSPYLGKDAAGMGYLTLENFKNNEITVKKYSGENISSNSPYSGCSTFRLQKKNSSGVFKNVGKKISLGQGCKEPTNSYTQEYTWKGLDGARYRVVEIDYTGEVVNRVTIGNEDLGSSENNTSKGFNLKNGAKAIVKFVNKDTYTIKVKKGQLDFAEIIDEKKEEDYYFKDIYGSTNKLKGCKTSNNDNSTGKIQCYQLEKSNKKITFSESVKEYTGTTTFLLQKYINNSWQTVGTKTVAKSDPNEWTVEWKVKSSGMYRVKETNCKNCGNGNTYVKIQAYKKKDSDTIASEYRKSLTSKAFYVGTYVDTNNYSTNYTGKPEDNVTCPQDTDKKDVECNPGTGNVYRVWFINKPSNSVCNDELGKIKSKYNGAETSEINNLKKELLELYNAFKNNTKLLNFSYKDTNINTILNNVDCSPGNTYIRKEQSCEGSSIGVSDGSEPATGEKIDDVKLMSYVNNDNFSKQIAIDIYDDEDLDNVYCFVNYKFDFSEVGIIKNNVNLYNQSFLWENPISNKVGTLTAYLHCEGINASTLLNSQPNKDNYLREKMIDPIEKIYVFVDPGGPNSAINLQTLDFSSEVDYLYKKTNEDLIENNEEEVDEKEDNSDIKEENPSPNDTTKDDPTDEVAEGDDKDEIVENVIIGDYQYYNATFDYNIVYRNQYYASFSNGTASFDKSKYRLGWGVPVDINSTGGNVNFNYKFDEDNDIYKLLKQNNDENKKLTSSCYYSKQISNKKINSDFNVRFINTSNPFLDKYGNVRTSGLNWNSCYIAKNTIGTYSKVAAKDISNAVSVEKEYTSIAGDDRYCMYGDVNCDEQIDRTDVGIIKDKLTNTTNENDKKLADVNKDGKVDDDDVSALEAYLIVSQYISSHSTWGTEFINAQWDYYIKGQDLTSAKNSIGWNLIGNNVKCNPGIISNNVIVDNKNNSSSDTPMYSFTLSPSDIKSIRSYNKEIKSYNNSNDLICEEGENCVSSFITDLLTKSNNLTVSHTGGLCLENNITSHTNIYKDENENDVEETSYSRLFCSNRNSEG